MDWASDGFSATMKTEATISTSMSATTLTTRWSKNKSDAKKTFSGNLDKIFNDNPVLDHFPNMFPSFKYYKMCQTMLPNLFKSSQKCSPKVLIYTNFSRNFNKNSRIDYIK